MTAISSVVSAYEQKQTTVSVGWPAWAAELATRMGVLGSYVVFYRNPDLRDYLEARNPDFAAWAKDRDIVEAFAAEDRALAANADGDGVRYVRCSNCGSVNLDPVVRVSDEVPV